MALGTGCRSRHGQDRRPSRLRMVRCPSLAATWCDTKYSWATGGREMTLDAVLAEVASTGLENVAVTGGEPLEHPGIHRRSGCSQGGRQAPPARDARPA